MIQISNYIQKSSLFVVIRGMYLCILHNGLQVHSYDSWYYMCSNSSKSVCSVSLSFSYKI